MIAYDKNWYKHFIIDNYKGQLVYQFKSAESPKLSFIIHTIIYVIYNNPHEFNLQGLHLYEKYIYNQI